MAKSRKLNVNESQIKVINQNETYYISLTDMTASFREGSGLIQQVGYEQKHIGIYRCLGKNQQPKF